MSAYKPILGFDDNLSNRKQEFAPTSYAIGKLRSGRTPKNAFGSIITNTNEICKPGLYTLFIKDSTNLFENSNTADIRSFCYLYHITTDPDESTLGGHVVNPHDVCMDVQQIAYFLIYHGTAEPRSIMRYRIGTKAVPASATSVIQEESDIKNLPYTTTWTYVFVNELGIWIKYKTVNGTNKYLPALNWSEWLSLGQEEQEYQHMKVEYVLSDITVEPNKIYVSSFNRLITLPNAEECQLGDTVTIEQWNVPGRVRFGQDGDIETIAGIEGEPRSYTYQVTYDGSKSPIDLNSRVWKLVSNSSDLMNVDENYHNGIALVNNRSVLSATAHLADTQVLGTVQTINQVQSVVNTIDHYTVPTVNAVWSALQNISTVIENSEIHNHYSSISNYIYHISNISQFIYHVSNISEIHNHISHVSEISNFIYHVSNISNFYTVSEIHTSTINLGITSEIHNSYISNISQFIYHVSAYSNFFYNSEIHSHVSNFIYHVSNISQFFTVSEIHTSTINLGITSDFHISYISNISQFIYHVSNISEIHSHISYVSEISNFIYHVSNISQFYTVSEIHTSTINLGITSDFHISYISNISQFIYHVSNISQFFYNSTIENISHIHQSIIHTSHISQFNITSEVSNFIYHVSNISNFIYHVSNISNFYFTSEVSNFNYYISNISHFTYNTSVFSSTIHLSQFGGYTSEIYNISHVSQYIFHVSEISQFIYHVSNFSNFYYVSHISHISEIHNSTIHTSHIHQSTISQISNFIYHVSNISQFIYHVSNISQFIYNVSNISQFFYNSTIEHISHIHQSTINQTYHVSNISQFYFTSEISNFYFTSEVSNFYFTSEVSNFIFHVSSISNFYNVSNISQFIYHTTSVINNDNTVHNTTNVVSVTSVYDDISCYSGVKGSRNTNTKVYEISGLTGNLTSYGMAYIGGFHPQWDGFFAPEYYGVTDLTQLPAGYAEKLALEEVTVPTRWDVWAHMVPWDKVGDAGMIDGLSANTLGGELVAYDTSSGGHPVYNHDSWIAKDALFAVNMPATETDFGVVLVRESLLPITDDDATYGNNHVEYLISGDTNGYQILIAGNAGSKCIVPALNAVALTVSRPAYWTVANGNSTFTRGIVQVQDTIVSSQTTTKTTINGTQYYKYQHVVPTMNALWRVSSSLDSHITNHPSTMAVNEVKTNGVWAGLSTGSVVAKADLAQYYINPRTLVMTSSAGTVYTTERVEYLDVTSLEGDYLKHQAVVPTINALWRVSNALFYTSTGLDSHIQNHPGPSINTTVINGVGLAYDEYNTLSAYGITAAFNSNGTTSSFVAGVVHTIDKIISLATDGNDVSYKFTVPTINVIWELNSTLTSHLDHHPSGGDVYKAGTGISLGAYTDSTVISAKYGTKHTTSNNGVGLTASNSYLYATAVLGWYRSNNSSGMGTVFVSDNITSLTSLQYVNSLMKHMVPNTQAVFNYVSTVVPQSIEDYLATHTW